MVGERQAAILAAVVREYIGAALPISSRALLDRCGFELSSATIRNDLAALEIAGLLTHIHTSSGRIPTDRGYRFFVDFLLEPNLSPYERRVLSDTNLKADLTGLCECLSGVTGAYTQIFRIRDGAVICSRLTAALDAPEFEDRAVIMKFLDILEFLRNDQALPDGFTNDYTTPKFFIGDEVAEIMNGATEFTLAAMRHHSDEVGDSYVMFVGPKRLAYSKIAGVFEFMTSTA